MFPRKIRARKLVRRSVQTRGFEKRPNFCPPTRFESHFFFHITLAVVDRHLTPKPTLCNALYTLGSTCSAYL